MTKQDLFKFAIGTCEDLDDKEYWENIAEKVAKELTTDTDGTKTARLFARWNLAMERPCWVEGPATDFLKNKMVQEKVIEYYKLMVLNAKSLDAVLRQLSTKAETSHSMGRLIKVYTPLGKIFVEMMSERPDEFICEYLDMIEEFSASESELDKEW